MENTLTVINSIALVVLAWYLSSLKGFINKYLDKKAENLATKEDIKTLTSLAEEVKTEFGRQLESYKQTLQYDLQIDINAAIAFRQKARESLEKVNLALNEVQTYCWDSSARIRGSEHYIPLGETDSVSEGASTPASFSYFRSRLDRLALTEALYLPESVVRSVKDLSDSIGLLGDAEVAIESNRLYSEDDDSPAIYESGLESAKACQRAIRSELMVRPSRAQAEIPAGGHQPAPEAGVAPSTPSE